MVVGWFICEESLSMDIKKVGASSMAYEIDWTDLATPSGLRYGDVPMSMASSEPISCYSSAEYLARCPGVAAAKAAVTSNRFLKPSAHGRGLSNANTVTGHSRRCTTHSGWPAPPRGCAPLPWCSPPRPCTYPAVSAPQLSMNPSFPSFKRYHTQ